MISNGKVTGSGIMNFVGHPKFTRYEGQFLNGYFHGIGILKLQNQEEYNGKWKLGMRSGEGVHKFSNENPFTKKYKGNWDNDNFNGLGALFLYDINNS